MAKTVLHITNGDSLTSYLKELDIMGEFLSWQEMLCEGPTIEKINSEKFFILRKDFIQNAYDIEVDENELNEELSKLDHLESYKEINLWFEYDLFCHINLVGVINLLLQKNVDLPFYLVCSGRVEGEKELKGLAELKPEQLFQHYKNRIRLNNNDLELAKGIWQIYCGKDHNLLKPYVVQSSNFKYMGACLKAHLKRFPDSKNGLSRIEENILIIVRDQDIRSVHHLLGYALNYQGFYGFGDLQMKRIINHLLPLIDQNDEGLMLTRDGHMALLDSKNVCGIVNNKMIYGGVNRLDFQFNKQINKLIKPVVNAY